MDGSDTIADVLEAGRAIWGDQQTSMTEIAVCTSVVAGDIARLARNLNEHHEINLDDAKRELGNLIVSGIRWAAEFGLNPDECVSVALTAQAAYR